MDKKEDSYVERRKLFKDIWDTAMQMDEKAADFLSKPKIIKTLRLDELDRTSVGKTKKQRIKNLRNVCNRLLDFCDRQEADDRFYQQDRSCVTVKESGVAPQQSSCAAAVAATSVSPEVWHKRLGHLSYRGLATEAGERPQTKVGETKPKKTKVLRSKKKMKKAKSYPPAGDANKPTTTVARDDLVPRAMKTAYPSVNRFKRTTVVKKPTAKNLNPKPSLIREHEPVKTLSGEAAARRKVVKVKTSKRKRLNNAPQAVKASINSKL